MQIIRFLAVLSLATGLARAQSQTAPVDKPITREEAIRLALEHNLEIQIQRYNPQIDLYDLRAAYGGWDPNFFASGNHTYSHDRGGAVDPKTGLASVGAERNTELIRSGLAGLTPIGMTYTVAGDMQKVEQINGGPGAQYSPDASLSLTQPLLKNLLIDDTRVAILRAKTDLKRSEYGLSRQIMDVVTRVEQAYYELIFARENVKVQEKALELAERSLSENKKRVEVGAMAPLDEKQAESLVAGSKADLLRAHQTLDFRENALKSLITDDYSKIHDMNLVPTEGLLPTIIQFDLLESWKYALTSRPDLQQLRVDLERADIELKYSRNSIFPQLDLTGTYGRNGLGSDIAGSLDTISANRFPNYTFGGVFRIPVGNITARNRYKATKLQKAQSILALKKLEQDIMVDVDNSVKIAQANFERIEATRQARLYAEAALEAEQKKLENGKSTSFVVLQLQKDLTTRRSEEIRALADYNNSLSGLTFSEGRTMDRNGLTLPPSGLK